MQEAPKVSVVIPVYNGEVYLEQCLDSVIRQTLRDIEIICVDDGSTDTTPEILRAYAEKDSRVIILTQENKNAGAARNRGMTVARGRYFSFLDADDFFEPDMLEKAWLNAEENQSDVVVFLSDNYIESLGTYKPISFSVREDLLPDRQPFAGVDLKKDAFRALMGWAWDKLFSAEFVRAHGLQFQEQRTTNDLLFVFSAIIAAERISIVREVLAHQRRRSTGSLSVSREKSWDCFYKALLAMRQQLTDWDLYSRFEQDFINYSLHFSLWHLNTLAWPTQEKLYRRLREGWFAELGLVGKPRGYFYHGRDYDAMRRIMTRDYAQVYSRLDSERHLVDQNGKAILPHVSVILLCRGGSSQIRRCLQSLLSQTEPLFELFCADADSADDTLSLLQEYEQQDYRVRILSVVGESYGRCLARGLEQARGEYCALVDMNDYAAPDMLGRLYALAGSNQLDAALSDYVTFSDGPGTRFDYSPCLKTPLFYGKVLSPAGEPDLPDILSICPQAGIYRTGLLRTVLLSAGSADSPSTDAQLIERLLAGADRVMFVREALYRRCGAPGPRTQQPGFFADLAGWIRRARAHGSSYARAYAAQLNSPVYRLGCRLSWLPRKVRGLVQCVRDHGLRYTWQLALSKLRR